MSEDRPAALRRGARMTHVAVRTTDMEASIDFYRRYAGLGIVQDRTDEGIRVVWVSHRPADPDFVIVLMSMPHEVLREPGATDHFGFAVESRADVDRIADQARDESLLKWGPVDAGPIVGYFCMVRDPSGNTCEFSHGQPIHPRDLPS